MELPKVIPEFSEARVSPKGKLNKADIDKIRRNMLKFLIPAILIYLGQVVLASSDNIVTLQDFIPTSFTMGGIVYYIASTLMDYLTKLNNDKE